MVKAFLGLGSNIGERETQLKEAIIILNLFDNINVTHISNIYEN